MKITLLMNTGTYSIISQYYTLRFYFPYLSLLAQPVHITLYGPGLDWTGLPRFRFGSGTVP
jgi:hypothetical protein